MPNSKQIVYLSQAQYAELIANGSITVNGVTVTYNENDIYVTPQAEPVTDVRVNGTSITANGVANIPMAGDNALGLVRVRSSQSFGVKIDSGGNLDVRSASSEQVKTGTASYIAITPLRQHEGAFYGLAKAAGHDEASSTESVGTYTPEAKGAIQQMLGVSDLIATSENNLVASKAYAIGDIFTANGKLYKATAAIAADAAIIPDGANANCEETSVGDGFPHDVQVNGVSVVTDGVANVPIAKRYNDNGGALGVISVGQGLTLNSGGMLFTDYAKTDTIKSGANYYQPITPINEHQAAFYGLAKAAGDATQAASDNAVGTYTDDAKAAIRTMLGAVGTGDKASTSTLGLVKISNNGISIDSGGNIYLAYANDAAIKAGTSTYPAITSGNQHKAVFYGLAKAAGDTTQSASSNAVGVYTDNAKASIKSMLGIVDGSTGTVDITGTTPTITAVENTRYVCGEVTSLSFTPPSSGISIVRFTSGSTVTVLTIPNTVKFPEWFDPTTLETNTIYEICVTDGAFGAVMSWAL